MFKIVIPSYKRPDIIKSHTLEALKKHNLLNKYEIYIFVGKDDYKSYKSLNIFYDKVKLIFGRKGLINQRNFIRNYFKEGELLWVLDDDIKDFYYNKKIINLEVEIIKTFKLMLKHKILLGGFNPGKNPYHNSNNIKIGNFLCVGCNYLEINTHIEQFYLPNKFNGEKEDYIRSLRYYKFCNGNIRNSNISTYHIWNGTNGGMEKDKRNYHNQKAIKYILLNYPDETYLRKTAKEEIILRSYNNINILFLKENEKNYNFSEYPDISNIYLQLDKNKSYYLYNYNFDLIGILLRNVFEYNDFDFKLLRKLTQYESEQRGDIGGKIDINRLTGWRRKIIDDNDYAYYNKKQTRIYQKSKGKKKAFNYGNIINCCNIGYLNNNMTQHYKYYEDEINNKFSKIINDIDKFYNYFYIRTGNKIKNKNKKILNSSFDNIIINRNLQSAIHIDKNNEEEASTLIVLDENEKEPFEGGELILNDYNIKIDLKHNKDILIFNSYRLAHSNLPITKNKDNRYSIVLFNKKNRTPDKIS